MKKILMTCVLLFSMTLHITAYADENYENMNARQIEDVQEFVTENVARVVGSPRGMLISSVELSLADLGSGSIRLYGDVLCHEPMKKIKLNLYLDQWIDSNDDWGQIEKFEFEWNAEDYPDEDLTMAMASVDVTNLDRGVDYQLRGIAGAWDLDSDLYEVYRANTASIMLE